MHWSQTAQPANRAVYKSERYGTENNSLISWSERMCTENLFREQMHRVSVPRTYMNGPIVFSPLQIKRDGWWKKSWNYGHWIITIKNNKYKFD